jgi:hypothetical protein
MFGARVCHEMVCFLFSAIQYVFACVYEWPWNYSIFLSYIRGICAGSRHQRFHGLCAVVGSLPVG